MVPMTVREAQEVLSAEVRRAPLLGQQLVVEEEERHQITAGQVIGAAAAGQEEMEIQMVGVPSLAEVAAPQVREPQGQATMAAQAARAALMLLGVLEPNLVAGVVV